MQNNKEKAVKNTMNSIRKHIKKFGKLACIGAIALCIVMPMSIVHINATEQNVSNAADIKAKVADAPQIETIRVGFSDPDKFIRAANGRHTGYGVEYLDKVAKYTGWNYEYIHGTWEECLKMMDDGQIDLVCTTDDSAEKREKYLYSDQHIGYAYFAFYVLRESEICYEDYESMNGCKFGVVNKKTNIESLNKIEKENNFDCDTILFNNESDILKALRQGEIEVAAISSLVDAGSLKVVGKHDPQNIYCVMPKTEKEKMQKLNQAIEKIKTENPGFEEKLLERFNDVDSYADTISFTKEESEYIRNAEPVKVVLMEDARPISYMKNGELAGIAVDFLNKLSKVCGIKFDFVRGTNETELEEYCEGALAGEYLLFGTKNAIKYSHALQGAIASDDFLDSKLSYLKRADTVLGNKKAQYTFAVTKELSYFEELMKNRPNSHKVVFYDSIEDCLDAVLEGEADIAVQDAYLNAYALKAAKYEKKLVECPGEVVPNNMCLIGSADESLLFQILSKSSKFISLTEKEELIAMELLSNPYEESLQDILIRNYRAIIIIIAMLIIAAIAYAVTMRKMAKLAIEKKEMELENEAAEASTRFMKILGMASVDIAGYEVDEEKNSLFVTKNYFKMINVDVDDIETLTVEEFLNIRNELNETKVFYENEDGSMIYRIELENGGERYLRAEIQSDYKKMVGLIEDVTANVQERIRLERERDYDILTNLYNRGGFRRCVETLFESGRKLSTTALLMLDLDNLKKTNDEFGHEVGDLYIKTAGKIFANGFEGKNICARVAGDEFLVLLYEYPGKEEIRSEVKKICDTVQKTSFKLPNGMKMHMSVSVGVAWYEEGEAEISQLVTYADFAMYEAKNKSKGGFFEFDMKEYQKKLRKNQCSMEFYQLIRDREVDYHFQPIFSSKDGNVYAYESLMRVNFSALHSPAMVMELAKELNKLSEIESITMFNSAGKYKRLLEQGHVCEEAFLFINSIANVCISDEDSVKFHEMFASIQSKIVIEITESEQMDMEMVKRKADLEGFSGLFALDDFGSGYNSEINLIELNPKFIKVDINLVRGIDRDINKQQIVKNMVDYAHDRDMLVLTEGIETASELYRVLELGVDLLQGYFLAKPDDVPLPIKEEALKTIESFWENKTLINEQ